MKPKLAFAPMGNGTSIHPFDELFDRMFPDDLSDTNVPNAMVFWGGTDIWPGFYGEEPHHTNQCQRGPSNRDKMEDSLMDWCISRGVPIIGVCRGAQLLCVKAGGTLIQNITGHHGDHLLQTDKGETLVGNSCHHQMMFPWCADNFKILAWSDTSLSKRYDTLSPKTKQYVDNFSFCETEAVWFPDVKGLAIQGHPEWLPSSHEFNKYVLSLVKEYVLK